MTCRCRMRIVQFFVSYLQYFVLHSIQCLQKNIYADKLNLAYLLILMIELDIQNKVKCYISCTFVIISVSNDIYFFNTHVNLCTISTYMCFYYHNSKLSTILIHFRNLQDQRAMFMMQLTFSSVVRSFSGFLRIICGGREGVCIRQSKMNRIINRNVKKQWKCYGK